MVRDKNYTSRTVDPLDNHHLLFNKIRSMEDQIYKKDQDYRQTTEKL